MEGHYRSAMERYRPGMTISEHAFAMAGSNPGAIIACAQLLKYDADAAGPGHCFGGSALILMDRLSIRDERIAMLWGDVCGHNANKMIAVIYACQYELAGVNKKTINHAIDNSGAGIDIDAVVSAAQERLPRFNPSVTKPVGVGNKHHPLKLIFSRQFWSAINRWLSAR